MTIRKSSITFKGKITGAINTKLHLPLDIITSDIVPYTSKHELKQLSIHSKDCLEDRSMTEAAQHDGYAQT